MKPVVRYKMNFAGKWLTGSAFFAGLAFFLCAVYYYVFGNIANVQNGKAFGVVIPLLILGVHMLLLKAVRLDIPLAYGGLAIVYCVCVLIGNFTGGKHWMNAVETVLYVLCAVALVFSLCGYFKGKWYLAAAFFAAAVGRFFFRDFLGYFDPLELAAAMPDAATISGLISLSCLCFGLKSGPFRIRNAEG